MTEITSFEKNGFKIIVIALEELQLYNVQAVGTSVQKHLEDRPQKVAMHLTEVKYVDSSGLGMLVSSYRSIKSWQGKMVIVSTSESVKKLIEISKLDKAIPIYPSLDEMFEKFNRFSN